MSFETIFVLLVIINLVLVFCVLSATSSLSVIAKQITIVAEQLKREDY